MVEEKGLDSIKSDSMREFYEKMIYDFSFLNQFGFYYRTYFYHWVIPGVIFDNGKNIRVAIYFSRDMGENCFYVSLYYENTLNYVDGISSLFSDEIEKLAYNNDSHVGYAIQYPIVKQKLIDYLYELRERGIV